MPLSELETRNEARSDVVPLSVVTPSLRCCGEAWEDAYLRFETPEQEVRKFTRRLRNLGAGDWPRDSRIVELFCGRGNGLRALESLGFANIEGVDLSAHLLERYDGAAARRHLADCRHLPFAGGSRDILIVQGGLHHLETLPDDLEQVLVEANRVLRQGGRFVAVEPWQTPFLRIVHAVCRSSLAGRLIPKIDALATMIRHERTTYENWLSNGPAILQLLNKHFHPVKQVIAWGKLAYVGSKN